ncbi:protein ECERIFERUM 2-like [Senna tora]|uniref:Protein ECERIFERUM 2-like n=1 Tax=Senna tora TaxID=362788 RepID=A0A834WM57_9FABA|nr:protein ECERIFERUM 2-like [Senna tora]
MEVKLKIEAVMSVTPLKMTEPRRVRKVVVEEGEGKKSETYGGCYQVVLYYEKGGKEGEEYGWVMGGWSVESLARALSEYPLLAGRLQRREEGEIMGMEIVSNDSGIRMVEARVYTSVSDFLQSSQMKDELEAELVFWKDIDEHTPQYSPLFYVTNFECGGYSIGISCSLFLAEIVVVENFLKKWAEIHNKILAGNGDTKTPIFYHPRLKNPDSPPSNIISRTPYKNEAQSMLFKITAQDLDFESLAMMCVEEAEKKLDRTMGSQFSLFVKDSSEVMKVEFWSKDEQRRRRRQEEELGLKSEMSSTTWDDFGVYEVAFHEGNRPVLVSRWIGSASEGNVVAVPHRENTTTLSALIIVTPPRP